MLCIHENIHNLEELVLQDHLTILGKDIKYVTRERVMVVGLLSQQAHNRHKRVPLKIVLQSTKSQLERITKINLVVTILTVSFAYRKLSMMRRSRIAGRFISLNRSERTLSESFRSALITSLSWKKL